VDQWGVHFPNILCSFQYRIVLIFVCYRHFIVKDANVTNLEPSDEHKFSMILSVYVCVCTRSTRYRSWLRHYATSRKVVGSIPDEIIGFFN
jgi:hypothetical protein